MKFDRTWSFAFRGFIHDVDIYKDQFVPVSTKYACFTP